MERSQRLEQGDVSMTTEVSGSSTGKEGSSTDKAGSSTDMGPDSQDWDRLMGEAMEMREKTRISSEAAREILMSLCDGDFLTLQQLSELVRRNPRHLRQHYLGPMAKEGILEILHPSKPNHPAQAYRKLAGAKA